MRVCHNFALDENWVNQVLRGSFGYNPQNNFVFQLSVYLI